ncbi:HAMP domain-containing histidine kinase [bacterium]|nr:MAG: HAMP domain-containing histidine kinase [bacterium]
MYGPIPVTDVNLPINSSPEDVKVKRAPADSVVNYIVRLLDESAPDLPLKISNLTEEIVSRLKNQFLSAGYPEPKVITAEGTEGAWDRLRVEQVVTNLLTNAIRYGKKNPVTVAVENLGDHIRLAVEDNGIGIAPEAREKIFDRFERAVDANEVSGLGLGLFISKQIVSAHGGKIWVESNEGKGSRFVLELPKAKAESAGREVVNVL